MKFGPFQIDIGDSTKSYEELVQIINREKGASLENLKGSPNQQLSEYKSWVFSCVSLISERVSTIPYYFYRTDTGEEVTSKNKAYKIFTKPFFKPNDLMTFRFLKSFCLLQLDLCGMTCIYKARNKLGQVWELWPLNMNDFVNIEINNDFLKPKLTYTFRFDDRQVEFDNSELIVINYPNPKNPYWPMSPIQAQAYSVDIDTYVEIYERDFFKNSARIDMALYTDQDINQEKADEIKNRWKSKYSGNYHDVAVLTSGLKPVPLKFTNKDFEFLNLAGWSKSKISSCYKVPLSKLGGEGDSNRASSVIADIAFNRECIQPRLTLIDEELTYGVLHEFDERLAIRHENPIPRDRDLEVKEARVYLSSQPSMAINEFRKEIHALPPVKGGEEILVSIKGSLVPLSRAKDFVDLLLSEAQDNQNTSTDGGDDETDPIRHDDDEGNGNADGTDDRDENPTDGRALNGEETINQKLNKFSEYEQELRETWNKLVLHILNNTNEQTIKQDLSMGLSKIIDKTIGVLFFGMGVKPINYDSKNWVSPISEKMAFEYKESIFKFNSMEGIVWEDVIKEQFNGNPRISKITNTLLKATINYAKWLVMVNQGIPFDWKINSNECGHRGRLDNIKSKQLFPNQVPNFSCDCTITSRSDGE